MAYLMAVLMRTACGWKSVRRAFWRRRLRRRMEAEEEAAGDEEEEGTQPGWGKA